MMIIILRVIMMLSLLQKESYTNHRNDIPCD